MGRPRWRASFLGHPDAKFLWKKASTTVKPVPRLCQQGARGRGLLFLLFLPKRSACLPRPGAVKGAPFLGAAQRTLEGEDRGDRIVAGGKDLGFIST